MIKREHTTITFSLQEPERRLAVQCTLLESGIFPVPETMTFHHPTPTFNRIFAFDQGGCHITTAHRNYTLEAGQIYLLPVNLAFVTTYRGGSRLFFFHLQVQDDLGMHLFSDRQGITALPEAGDLFADIISHYDISAWEATLRWQFALTQVVLRFCKPLLPALSPRHEAPGKYRALLDLLEQTCRPGLTVQELAAQLQCSPAALSKGFQRTFGIPLNTYINQRLLHRAADLLTATDLTVEEITVRLGYQDACYFYRVFKKQMGTTPVNYRNQSRRTRLTE